MAFRRVALDELPSGVQGLITGMWFRINSDFTPLPKHVRITFENLDQPYDRHTSLIIEAIDDDKA